MIWGEKWWINVPDVLLNNYSTVLIWDTKTRLYRYTQEQALWD